MRLRFWLSLGYALGQKMVGLLVHPYQTMQSLVLDRVLSWLALTPTLVLAVVTIVWKGAVVPLIQSFFSCRLAEASNAGGWLADGVCGFLPFLADWFVFYCVYWQIMLLYLLFRFRAAYR